MSLKNKFFSILTVAISVAALSVFSFGQDGKPATTTDKADRHAKGEGREFGKRRHDREGMGGERGGGMRHRGMMGMMRGINLTDAQKEQIKAIRLANKPNQASMEEFRTLAKAKHEGTLTAEQQERLTTLRSQAHEKGKGVHEQIMGVFTAEQKAQIENRKQEMKQKREEFRKQRELRKANPAATMTEKPKVS